jgi:outer membrane cobalamin receptor
MLLLTNKPWQIFMKTAFFTLALTIALLSASTAFAGDETKTKDVKKAPATGAEKKQKTQVASEEGKGGVLVTGSYIKQPVRRNGRITDGANQVIVIDRDTIERSGASDVKQLLVHQGIH